MNNKPNNRFWIIMVIILVIINIATVTTFWLLRENDPAIKPGQGKGAMEFLVKELQLDSLQQEKFKDLREEHQQQMREVRTQIRDAKDAMFTLLKSPEATDTIVEKASLVSAALEAKIDMITFRHFKKIRAICDSSQQIKFDAIINQVVKMIAPGPGGNRPPGPPPMGAPDGLPPAGEGQRPPPPRD